MNGVARSFMLKRSIQTMPKRSGYMKSSASSEKACGTFAFRAGVLADPLAMTRLRL
jgi:hypothetical protein